jgi:hypothetical protein
LDSIHVNLKKRHMKLPSSLLKAMLISAAVGAGFGCERREADGEVGTSEVVAPAVSKVMIDTAEVVVPDTLVPKRVEPIMVEPEEVEPMSGCDTCGKG